MRSRSTSCSADIERMIVRLRDGLKAGRARRGRRDPEGHSRRRARAAHRDGPVRRLAPGRASSRALRAEVARTLQAEIDNLPGQVRRVLRPRSRQGGARRFHGRCRRGGGDRGEARARRDLPQLCGRACDQRGDAAHPFRSAELFRHRHAAAARPAARIACRPSAASASRSSMPRCGSAPNCSAPTMRARSPRPPMSPPRASRRPRRGDRKTSC